jgi:uncharacterized membrane-anchored protein
MNKTFLSKSKIVLILLVLLVQISVVSGLYFTNFIIIDNSIEAKLKLVPVDPRDFFRGDYVVLNYEISRVKNVYYYGRELKQGDKVYVNLYQNNYGSKIPELVFSNISENEPYYNENDPSSLFLKATVKYAYKMPDQAIDQYGNSTNGQNNQYSEIALDYGLEQLFIPEGAGKNLSLQNTNSFGIIKIDPKGNSRVDRLEIDGKNWPEAK